MGYLSTMDSTNMPSRKLYRLTVLSFVVSAFLHVIVVFAALSILQPGLDANRPIFERASYLVENTAL